MWVISNQKKMPAQTQIIAAALQLHSLPVHFVLPPYQLLNIFKAIQVATLLYLFSYCIAFSALVLNG